MRNYRRFRRAARPRSKLAKAFDWFLAVAILASVGLIAARYERIATRTLGGRVTVADGDSLVLNGTKIRLRGIDAPEYNQTCARGGETYPCGRQARGALQQLVRAGPVVCEGSEIDRYERLLAYCRAGAADMNQSMVRQGWAVSHGAYETDEAEARKSKSGLWAGTFDRPRDWRATHGGVAEPDKHDWLEALANWIAQLAGWRDMEASGT